MADQSQSSLEQSEQPPRLPPPELTNSGILVMNGQTFYKHQRYADALAWCERAIECVPRDNATAAEAWAWKGLALARLDRAEEGLAAVDHALTIRSRGQAGVFALQAKGIVLYDLKRYDEALAAYLRALALFPVITQEVRTWEGIAIIYRALNLPTAAQEAEHLASVARERSNQEFARSQEGLQQRHAETATYEARRRWRAKAAIGDTAATTE